MGEQARAWGVELRQIEANLHHLARTEPDHFDASGQPKPKSKAAELRAKRDAAQGNNWQAMLDGADQRVTEAEAEVRDLIRDQVVALARAQYERGLEAKDRLTALAAELKEAVAAVKAPEHVLREVAVSVGGPFDGRSVEVDDRWQELDRVLDSADEYRPARIAAMTPYTDEDPIIKRTGDGSWLSVRSGPPSGWAEEQPERIERPS